LRRRRKRSGPIIELMKQRKNKIGEREKTSERVEHGRLN
jgi:hypothetical protein